MQPSPRDDTGRVADTTRRLLDRLDRAFQQELVNLLGAVADATAAAIGDAVTIRALSEDGEWLIPVAMYHRDHTVRSALEALMQDTADRSDAGLWGTVIEQRRPARWRVAEHEVPPEASAEQLEFMRRYRVRAVLGAPVIAHERIVGGIALVRHDIDRPHSDDDEALLVRVADRIAPVLELLPRRGFPLPPRATRGEA